MDRDLERVRQLPSWGDADIPEDRDRFAVDDRHGLGDVIKVFIRTWPYMLPLVLGYWREKALIRTSRFAGADTDWSYRHAPILATVLAALGPFNALAF